MKADLYVQGRYWASIDVPGDSLLALLAQGLATRAKILGHQLQEELVSIDGITCTVSLRFKEPTTYTPAAGD